MRFVRILDCTLRDGGYCNQWNFGKTNIIKVINGLTDADIDIIECGFISNKVKSDEDKSKFTSIEEASAFLPFKKRESMYVAMINYGEYDCNSIPENRSDLIDGIRVAFHKKDITDALNDCKLLIEKGYKVFVQAMVTLSYSDYEFLNLIEKVNKISPYAFYIVDSFGVMKKRDLIRYFSIAENNLNKEVYIGFHSHNNLQLAYSNTLALIDMRAGRDLIIDSTVYGMGRGAGNLNTELFIDHMNTEYDYGYDLKPILTIMDEVINDFYRKNPWGYSLPNYLSAIHNAHPNYAGYLSDKCTLTIDMMDDIFARMDIDKKKEYSKEYIEKTYIDYMDAGRAREIHHEEFNNKILNKTILLIAPGKSSETEKNKIIKFATSKDVVSISINFDYGHIKTDFVFISNAIRFKELSVEDKNRCLITSNIPDNEAYLQIKYAELLNDDEFVKDNAGLMAVKLMIQHGAKNIVLAGFDGYSYDILNNYAGGQRVLITKKATIDATNLGMSNVLKKLSCESEISFLTKPLHYNL